ncbi:MAG: hypothetical protein PHU25_06900 [Deltaproteobacteria bacterium]|nr:hypothetical protein [Deltaproteobacteria bacterium]
MSQPRTALVAIRIAVIALLSLSCQHRPPLKRFDIQNVQPHLFGNNFFINAYITKNPNGLIGNNPEQLDPESKSPPILKDCLVQPIQLDLQKNKDLGLRPYNEMVSRTVPLEPNDLDVDGSILIWCQPISCTAKHEDGELQSSATQDTKLQSLIYYYDSDSEICRQMKGYGFSWHMNFTQFYQSVGNFDAALKMLGLGYTNREESTDNLRILVQGYIREERISKNQVPKVAQDTNITCTDPNFPDIINKLYVGHMSITTFTGKRNADSMYLTAKTLLPYGESGVGLGAGIGFEEGEEFVNVVKTNYYAGVIAYSTAPRPSCENEYWKLVGQHFARNRIAERRYNHDAPDEDTASLAPQLKKDIVETLVKAGDYDAVVDECQKQKTDVCYVMEGVQEAVDHK